MVHFLHLTRFGDPREVYGFQAEAEPAGDDAKSYLWMTDFEYEFGDKEYPRTNHTCNHMEVDGHDTGVDDEAAGMLPAEDVSDEFVRHVRNTVPSDDDGDDDDRDANDGFEVDPEHPPGTIPVVDDISPMDANNPCEFSLPW